MALRCISRNLLRCGYSVEQGIRPLIMALRFISGNLLVVWVLAVRCQGEPLPEKGWGVFIGP
jgi:hypothetical protein